MNPAQPQGESDEFDLNVTWVCPVCRRRGGFWDWSVHPDFGYRRCQRCEKDGLNVVPVRLSKETLVRG